MTVAPVPAGSLTYYTMEGEGASGSEYVELRGLPSGSSMRMTDGVNPVDNPMNRTINTTTPVQRNVAGVDVDEFDISAALSEADTSVDVVFSASTDKYWIVASVVGLDSAPEIGGTKSWAWVDTDGDGFITIGDTSAAGPREVVVARTPATSGPCSRS